MNDKNEIGELEREVKYVEEDRPRFFKKILKWGTITTVASAFAGLLYWGGTQAVEAIKQTGKAEDQAKYNSLIEAKSDSLELLTEKLGTTNEKLLKANEEVKIKNEKLEKLNIQVSTQNKKIEEAYGELEVVNTKLDSINREKEKRIRRNRTPVVELGNNRTTNTYYGMNVSLEVEEQKISIPHKDNSYKTLIIDRDKEIVVFPTLELKAQGISVAEKKSVEKYCTRVKIIKTNDEIVRKNVSNLIIKPANYQPGEFDFLPMWDEREVISSDINEIRINAEKIPYNCEMKVQSGRLVDFNRDRLLITQIENRKPYLKELHEIMRLEQIVFNDSLRPSLKKKDSVSVKRYEQTLDSIYLVINSLDHVYGLDIERHIIDKPDKYYEDKKRDKLMCVLEDRVIRLRNPDVENIWVGDIITREKGIIGTLYGSPTQYINRFGLTIDRDKKDTNQVTISCKSEGLGLDYTNVSRENKIHIEYPKENVKEGQVYRLDISIFKDGKLISFANRYMKGEKYGELKKTSPDWEFIPSEQKNEHDYKMLSFEFRKSGSITYDGGYWLPMTIEYDPSKKADMEFKKDSVVINGKSIYTGANFDAVRDETSKNKPFTIYLPDKTFEVGFGSGSAGSKNENTTMITSEISTVIDDYLESDGKLNRNYEDDNYSMQSGLADESKLQEKSNAKLTVYTKTKPEIKKNLPVGRYRGSR